MDAEYYRALNPEADSEWMDEAIRRTVIETLLDEKAIDTPEQVRVIVLDASNAEKFSKHYLFKVQRVYSPMLCLIAISSRSQVDASAATFTVELSCDACATV